MLRIEDAAKSFGGQQLFTGLSFQLTKGERCSLVGRNGSGKSTLLKMIMGMESFDSGSLLLPKNYRLGYLKQEVSFTQQTLLEEASLSLHKEERHTPYRAEAILFGLGFTAQDLLLPPTRFSGGYQLRIQLAKTLLQEPDCLLLDEPTNYLDVVSIRWLESFLHKWPKEMILISHDRNFLDNIATHTMGLHRGKLLRVEGTTANYYNRIMEWEEAHERTRIKIEKQKEHAASYIQRFGAKATKASQAQARKKVIEKLPSLEKLAQLEGLRFHFNEAPFTGKRQLLIDSLSFRFPGMQDPLIDNLFLEVAKGDRIALIGKNGRGKSTFLRLLAEQLRPDAGKLSFADNVSVGFFGQTNVEKLNLSLTVEEEIALANPQLSMTEVRKICGMMMFPGTAAEKKIAVLSGGEKSRVLLGKILATPCNLLLLDEPSNHLDLESVEALMEALENFTGTVVLVSHDEEILQRLPDKLLIFRRLSQELFPNDYGTFLEKIGWEPDAKSDKPIKRDNVKEVKRKRAELIQERSKALAPLKKQALSLERKIEETEKALHSMLQELEAALANGDTQTTAKLSKELGQKQKACEHDYLQLDVLYQQIERINSSFDTL